MDPRTIRVAAPAALAVLAALSSCSPGSQVLARVGDDTITVQEFIEVARGAQSFYAGVPPDSAKARLLDDMVRRAVLLEEAKRQGLDRDGRLRRQAEDEVLMAALAERLTPRTVPVSDAEIRRLYEWRSAEARVQLIFAVEREKAEAAMTELRFGRDFASVADRFNITGLLPPGGDLGFMAPGTLVNPIDRYVRELLPGQAIGPIQAPGEGWFIIKVVERRPRVQEPFEEARLTLSQMLARRKQRALAVRRFTSLRQQYRLRVEAGAAELLFARFNLPSDIDTVPPVPTQEELGRKLARYDGGAGDPGVYTLGDALQDLETGAGDRPNFSVLPSYRPWIEGRVLRRIGLIEARRRHLQEEPAIAKRIDNQVNDQLLDAVYQAQVVATANPTPDDVRAAYQRHGASLIRLDWVRVQHLTMPDSASAARAIERARQSATLVDAILLSSEGMKVQEETVRFPTADPVWQSLRQTFIDLSPAGYGGPVRTPNGWRIFQVVAKQQFQPPFETLDPAMQQMLTSAAAELAHERRLREVTDALGRSQNAQSFPERLKSIPWPLGPERAPAG